MWNDWGQALIEALIVGSWALVLPAACLVIVSSTLSLHLVTLRRAWLSCVLFGIFAFFLTLSGGRFPSLGWGLELSIQSVDRWQVLVLSVYAAGVAIVLGRAMLGWLLIRRWTSRAQPIHSKEVVDAFEIAKAANEIQSPCYLLAGQDVPAPVSVGLLNHRVLIPQRLIDDLIDTEMRDLALHEMAHIRRKDPAAFALSVVASAVLWPNPFVWLAIHQFKLNAEKLADESVIEVTEEVRPYSQLLVKMAELTTPRSAFPLAAGVNLQKSFFLQRAEALVAGMLTEAQSVRSSSSVWIALVLGIGGALAFAPRFAVRSFIGTIHPESTLDQVVLNRPVAVEHAPVKIEDSIVSTKFGPTITSPSDPFYRAGWIPLRQAHPESYQLSVRALEAIGLRQPPRYRAYRSLENSGLSKISLFAFETESGDALYIGLNRGDLGSDTSNGPWVFSKTRPNLSELNAIPSNSNLERALVELLRAWSVATMGSEERLYQVLSVWPEMDPFGAEHAALVMAETLETFEEISLYTD